MTSSEAIRPTLPKMALNAQWMEGPLAKLSSEQATMFTPDYYVRIARNNIAAFGVLARPNAQTE